MSPEPSTERRLRRSPGSRRSLNGTRRRCDWCGSDPLYVSYHDNEWGIPVHDDRKHFEMLTLEGAQAGLSWLTILRKRKGYTRAFERWNVKCVAAFGPGDVRRLMSDPGIVRNRLKIERTITNARAFLRVQEEFGTFDAYVWSFVANRPVRIPRRTINEIPSASPESDMLSKDLKRRGFGFVGSTIMYAFMQANGLVNDHIRSCYKSRNRRRR